MSIIVAKLLENKHKLYMKSFFNERYNKKKVVGRIIDRPVSSLSNKLQTYWMLIDEET